LQTVIKVVRYFLFNEPFMSSGFTNVTVALRLYITLTVTVCEAEMSFSKLALIKTDFGRACDRTSYQCLR